jgi:hypothetical protein
LACVRAARKCRSRHLSHEVPRRGIKINWADKIDDWQFKKRHQMASNQIIEKGESVPFRLQVNVETIIQGRSLAFVAKGY